MALCRPLEDLGVFTARNGSIFTFIPSVRVLSGNELAVWDQREARMQETDLVSGGGAFF